MSVRSNPSLLTISAPRDTDLLTATVRYSADAPWKPSLRPVHVPTQKHNTLRALTRCLNLPSLLWNTSLLSILLTIMCAGCRQQPFEIFLPSYKINIPRASRQLNNLAASPFCRTCICVGNNFPSRSIKKPQSSLNPVGFSFFQP